MKLVAEVLCQPLQLVTNATMDGNETGLGAIITYTCRSDTRFLDGYETKTVRCQEDEQWNETLTTCDGRNNSIDSLQLSLVIVLWLISCPYDVHLYGCLYVRPCGCLSACFCMCMTVSFCLCLSVCESGSGF